MISSNVLRLLSPAACNRCYVTYTPPRCIPGCLMLQGSCPMQRSTIFHRQFELPFQPSGRGVCFSIVPRSYPKISDTYTVTTPLSPPRTAIYTRCMSSTLATHTFSLQWLTSSKANLTKSRIFDKPRVLNLGKDFPSGRRRS